MQVIKYLRIIGPVVYIHVQIQKILNLKLDLWKLVQTISFNLNDANKVMNMYREMS